MSLVQSYGSPAITRTRLEHVRVGREHHRGHPSAGREPRDVRTRRIGAVRALRMSDHLPDRRGLALAAPVVDRLEPVEAGAEVVRGRRLGEDEQEAVPVGEGGQPGVVGVDLGALRAAVQCDDDRRMRGQARRPVHVHVQSAGIGTEVAHSLQRHGGRVRRGRIHCGRVRGGRVQCGRVRGGRGASHKVARSRASREPRILTGQGRYGGNGIKDLPQVNRGAGHARNHPAPPKW